MTPAEHYTLAERCLEVAARYDGYAPDTAAAYRQTAQVHATLANATQAHVIDTRGLTITEEAGR